MQQGGNGKWLTPREVRFFANSDDGARHITTGHKHSLYRFDTGTEIDIIKTKRKKVGYASVLEC